MARKRSRGTSAVNALGNRYVPQGHEREYLFGFRPPKGNGPQGGGLRVSRIPPVDAEGKRVRPMGG